MLAMTVPFPVIPLTATLKVVPGNMQEVARAGAQGASVERSVTTAERVPVALPADRSTSAPLKPVTGWLKTAVKLIGLALVGSD